MSLVSAREFAKLVMRNEEIGRQVVAVTAGKTQPEAARAVSDLAASAGYEFTPEEGYLVSQEALAGIPPAGSGELTEEDLELVAGGLTVTYGGASGQYIANNTGQGVSGVAGALVPGVGAPIGAIAGGVVNGIVNGDPNNSTGTNAALGAGQGYTDFKTSVTNVVNTIFSGW